MYLLLKKLSNFIFNILRFIVGIVLGLYITVRALLNKETRQMFFQREVEQAINKAITKYGPY